MLYGYDRDEAYIIRDTLAQVLSAEIELISASGKEKRIVMDIINDGPSEEFEDVEDKVLMVLSFTDEDLEQTLRGFPKAGGMVRPIFCMLTDHNSKWPLSQLIEDLLREREHIQSMMAGRDVQEGNDHPM
jgi:hypothetical protein